MAQLDKRNDDFIRMLLDVSGRARPSDLHGMDDAQAAELLQAYLSAHPERSLAISDGVLVPSIPAVAEAVPVAVGVPSPESWAPAPAVTEPLSDFGGPAVEQPVHSEIPSWVYEQPDASADLSPQTVDPYAVPVDVTQDPAGAYAVPVVDPLAQPAGQAAPTDVPAVQAPLEPSASVATAWQPAQEPVPAADDWQGSAEAYSPDMGVFPDEQPLAWYWWLVPLFFSLVGGLIAWLILRKTQPKGARKMLIFGAIVLAVNILISVLTVVFGLGAFMTSGTVGALPTVPGYPSA